MGSICQEVGCPYRDCVEVGMYKGEGVAVSVDGSTLLPFMFILGNLSWTPPNGTGACVITLPASLDGFDL